MPVDEVTKAMRQRGKVAELALGFCGGVGALQSMAAGYGLHFTDAEAQRDRRALARGQPVGDRLLPQRSGTRCAARHTPVPGVPSRGSGASASIT